MVVVHQKYCIISEIDCKAKIMPLYMLMEIIDWECPSTKWCTDYAKDSGLQVNKKNEISFEEETWAQWSSQN